MAENTSNDNLKNMMEEQTEYDTRAQVIFIHPLTATSQKLLDALKRDPQCNIIESGSALEAMQIAQMYQPCVLTGSMNQDSDIVKMFTLFAGLKSEIKTDQIKTLLLATVKDPRIIRKFSDLGCTDYILEPVPLRQLQHKFNLQIKANRAARKRHNDKDRDLKRLDQKQLKNDLEMTRGDFRELPANETEQDCWILKGKPRLIGGEWNAYMQGPPPREGAWERASLGQGDAVLWKYVPKNPEASGLKGGNWIFCGKKPSYQNQEWSFIGNAPQLYFQSSVGKILFYKLKLAEDKKLEIAKDSAVAKQRLAMSGPQMNPSEENESQDEESSEKIKSALVKNEQKQNSSLNAKDPKTKAPLNSGRLPLKEEEEGEDEDIERAKVNKQKNDSDKPSKSRAEVPKGAEQSSQSPDAEDEDQDDNSKVKKPRPTPIPPGASEKEVPSPVQKEDGPGKTNPASNAEKKSAYSSSHRNDELPEDQKGKAKKDRAVPTAGEPAANEGNAASSKNKNDLQRKKNDQLKTNEAETAAATNKADKKNLNRKAQVVVPPGHADEDEKNTDLDEEEDEFNSGLKKRTAVPKAQNTAKPTANPEGLSDANHRQAESIARKSSDLTNQPKNPSSLNNAPQSKRAGPLVPPENGPGEKNAATPKDKSPLKGSPTGREKIQAPENTKDQEQNASSQKTRKGATKTNRNIPDKERGALQSEDLTEDSELEIADGSADPATSRHDQALNDETKDLPDTATESLDKIEDSAGEAETDGFDAGDDFFPSRNEESEKSLNTDPVTPLVLLMKITDLLTNRSLDQRALCSKVCTLILQELKKTQRYPRIFLLDENYLPLLWAPQEILPPSPSALIPSASHNVFPIYQGKRLCGFLCFELRAPLTKPAELAKYRVLALSLVSLMMELLSKKQEKVA